MGYYAYGTLSTKRHSCLFSHSKPSDANIVNFIWLMKVLIDAVPDKSDQWMCRMRTGIWIVRTLQQKHSTYESFRLCFRKFTWFLTPVHLLVFRMYFRDCITESDLRSVTTMRLDPLFFFCGFWCTEVNLQVVYLLWIDPHCWSEAITTHTVVVT